MVKISQLVNRKALNPRDRIIKCNLQLIKNVFYIFVKWLTFCMWNVLFFFTWKCERWSTFLLCYIVQVELCSYLAQCYIVQVRLCICSYFLQCYCTDIIRMFLFGTMSMLLFFDLFTFLIHFSSMQFSNCVPHRNEIKSQNQIHFKHSLSTTLVYYSKTYIIHIHMHYYLLIWN